MKQLKTGRNPNYLGRIKRQILKIIEADGTKDSDRLKACEVFLRTFGKESQAIQSARLLEEKMVAARLKVKAAALKAGKALEEVDEDEPVDVEGGDEGGTRGGESEGDGPPLEEEEERGERGEEEEEEPEDLEEKEGGGTKPMGRVGY